MFFSYGFNVLRTKLKKYDKLINLKYFKIKNNLEKHSPLRYSLLNTESFVALNQQLPSANRLLLRVEVLRFFRPDQSLIHR